MHTIPEVEKCWKVTSPPVVRYLKLANLIIDKSNILYIIDNLRLVSSKFIKKMNFHPTRDKFIVSLNLPIFSLFIQQNENRKSLVPSNSVSVGY